MSDLLPPNATPLMQALDGAIRPEITAIPHVMRFIYDPECCPIEALPHLAWAWSVDVWNDRWPEAVKRRVIKNSLYMHRIKGSVGAVELALASVFADGEIQEWFETGDPVHTFRAVVSPTIDLLQYDDGVLFHDDLIDELRRVIAAAKPLREHFAIRLRPRMRLAPRSALGMAGRQRSVLDASARLPRFILKGPVGIASATVARSRLRARAKVIQPPLSIRTRVRLAGGFRLVQNISLTMTATNL